MKTHELKINQQYLKLIIDGRKNWEVRKNDRNFKEGETIIVKEYLPETNSYTGREAEGTILYVFSTNEMLKPGYVILSVKWTRKTL